MRFALLALLIFAAPAAGQDAPQGARVAADAGVQIEKPAGDGVNNWIGSGVYIGGGWVLTAAHVVDHTPARHVVVLIDGRRTDGEIVSQGAQENPDLATLKLPLEALRPERRGPSALFLCRQNPHPNQPVVVAEQGRVSLARTVGTPITSRLKTTDGWTDLLTTGYHHGSSGGGVFDPQTGCLWGVLRLEMSSPPRAAGPQLDLTAFTPASDIAAFLPAPALRR